MSMLVSFALLFGVINMISFAGRLTRIDFGSILGNYGDFLMQLNHVSLYFTEVGFWGVCFYSMG